MARVPQTHTNLRARRRRRRALLMSASAGALALAIALLLALTWAPFLRVEAVTISGEHTISQSALEQTAQHDLAGGYLRIVAKNDILFYPKQTIERDILATYPSIKSVAVHAANLHTIDVVVAERQPVALWCGERFASTTDCYLMDDAGVIYAPATPDAASYTPYFGAARGSALPKQFLAQGQLHALATLVASIQSTVASDTLESVEVDAVSDVHLHFTSGFELLFALSDDPASVYRKLKLALSAQPFESHTLSEFEYLDLRFGDKLYYKLKGKN